MGRVTIALATFVALAPGCRPPPGEGEPCRWESTGDYGGTAYVECASGLECDRTLCLPVDGPEAPRRFGEFVGVYDPSSSSPQRIFETAGNGAPWAAIDRARIVVGFDFVYLVDHGGGASRTIGERLVENATDSIAIAGDEVWALGELGSTRGYALPDLAPIRTGLYTGPGEARAIAGNEAGELAWLGEGTAVLSRSRGAELETFPVTGTVQTLVVEPGGRLLALADGRLVSPTGRTVGAHEPLSGLHRPRGGPTLGWIDTNDATTPTRVVIVEEDGAFTPVVTLPIELSSITRIDAVDGHLYLSCEWGLFVSSGPLEALAR